MSLTWHGSLRRVFHDAARGWALCAPALAFFVVFFITPVFFGLLTSLHEWNGFSPVMNFVGMKNYVGLFSEYRFWSSVLVTAMIFLLMISIKLPLAILLAWGLSAIVRGGGLYRSAIFFPFLLSTTAVAGIWHVLLDPYFGLVNQFLLRVGLDSWRQGWLAAPGTAVFSVVVAHTWWTIGFYVLLFTAALASIPQIYHDAAQLEVRSPIKRFLYITLPLMREQIFTASILIAGGALGFMTGLIVLLTGGGPAGQTETLGVLSYLLAFRGQEFGRASAVSMIVFVTVVLLMAYPVIRISRRRVEFK